MIWSCFSARSISVMFSQSKSFHFRVNVSVHSNSIKINISITPPVHWFCLPQTILSTNSWLQGSRRNRGYASGKPEPEAKWVFRFYFIFFFQHVVAKENMAAQSGAEKREKERRKLYPSSGVTSSPLTCYFHLARDWQLWFTEHNYHFDPKNHRKRVLTTPFFIVFSFLKPPGKQWTSQNVRAISSGQDLLKSWITWSSTINVEGSANT